ncbi:tetratricopeptide repeat protein [Chitinophaga nivalis]|uniref:Tetratricopeptide repeat protein n=1 Tax=Chitinophaga nivalis TaxID=2991709 RepID=A0ABT3IV38_9BACT|nr:tetratricopeptide repeat protein [Chitinophaga nivalis]MCW3462771.1 tetratricopeptide repeat protein [Chitinophaga nivalis]MCW3487539.1 tetratricopeptide repeat protein [Chitinophaga nivalis]
MAVLIQRAQFLLEQGRYQDALTTLRQHLSTSAHDTDALFLLAVCYMEMNNEEEAAGIVSNTLSFAPDDDRFLYLQARLFLNKNQFNEAIRAIGNAVAINPYRADYFGMWSQILLFKKDYQGALQKAEEGLAINPEDESCLNLRSHALFNLGKKEEAFSDLHEALEHNPENAYTHANLGWKWLEAGDHRKSLEHFRESLKLDPTQTWAKNGMVQAMKARYWLYRQFLNYAFFMGRQKAGTQWIIIIGIFILTQIASRVFFPVYVLLALLAVSTWLIVPVSNLFLRLNPYGRYALTPEQTNVSNWVGILLGTGLLAAIAYWVTAIPALLSLAIGAGVLLLPVSSMYAANAPKSRRIFRWYTLALAVCGLLGVGFTFITADPFNIFVTVMLIGVFLYQFLANYIISREA